MSPYCLSDCLTDLGHQPWVLENANWWVVFGRNVLKLVVSVKLHLPPEFGDLVDESGLHQMDGTLIDTRPRLPATMKRDQKMIQFCRRCGPEGAPDDLSRGQPFTVSLKSSHSLQQYEE